VTKGIAPRVAVELVFRALGRKVSLDRLARTLRHLDRDSRMSATYTESGLMLPEDVDRAVGELHRMAAPWYQKRNVRGDYEAWVRLAGGEWRLLSLPYVRAWNAEARAEDVGVPDRVRIWTWPTAEERDELVLVGTRYDLPAYVVQDAAEEIRIEDGEDVISWQEKDGSETQDPKP
jgi:hypothetical protein